MNIYAQLNELFNISNSEEKKQIIKTLRVLIRDFEREEEINDLNKFRNRMKGGLKE